jgi:hypothetical protein
MVAPEPRGKGLASRALGALTAWGTGELALQHINLAGHIDYRLVGHSTNPSARSPKQVGRASVDSIRAALAWCPMLAHRRQPSRLVITPMLSSLATRTSALGIGFGDRFEGFQGCSGSSEKRVQQAKKQAKLQGKRATKRLLGIT